MWPKTTSFWASLKKKTQIFFKPVGLRLRERENRRRRGRRAGGGKPQPTQTSIHHRRRNQRRRHLHDCRPPPPAYANELRTTITDIDFKRSRRFRPPPPPPYAVEGYSGNYGNPEAGYAANPYQACYGGNPMNPIFRRILPRSRTRNTTTPPSMVLCKREGEHKTISQL